MKEKNIKEGFTLIDELLVDITGSVIPGFLFIIITFICFIVPLFLFSKITLLDLGRMDISSGFFWVLLIIIVILSYVIGHLFYRADIAVPDKVDILREIDAEIAKIKTLYLTNRENFSKQIYNELQETLLALNDSCKHVTLFQQLKERNQRDCNATNAIYICFQDSCKQAVEQFEKIKEKGIYETPLLGVLFPEETYRNKMCNSIPSEEDKKEKDENAHTPFSKVNNEFIEMKDLDERLSRIWENEYKDKITRSDRLGKRIIVDDTLLDVVIAYCILNVQIEIGCISPSEASFPYVYYYKYLLKRNICDLLDEVTWNSRDGRSKNVINAYKLYLQLFVPEKYAIINKNESHVRMSSSTWHMAGVAMKMAAIMLGLVVLLLTISRVFPEMGISTTPYRGVLALGLPLGTIVFCWFARGRIVKYIHYQRNREIFHTICAYEQCKKIIEHRKWREGVEIPSNVRL